MPATAKSKRGSFIAAWYAGCSGLRWLDKLVDEEKVIFLTKDMFPGIYSGKARDILPVIENMPPYVEDKYEWVEDKETGKQTLVSSKNFGKSDKEIASCYNEEWLRIEIWDLS